MKPRLLLAAAVISVATAIPLTGALTHQADLQRAAQSKAYALQIKLVADKKAEIAKAEQVKIEQAKQIEIATAAKVKADADAAAAEKQRQASLAFQTTPQCATYQGLVAQYDWPVQTAMAIMRAESGCRAITPSNAAINYDGVPDYGLFQLHGIDVTDPAENVRIAYQVKYVGAGRRFTPWSTYNNGAYTRYLQ